MRVVHGTVVVSKSTINVSINKGKNTTFLEDFFDTLSLQPSFRPSVSIIVYKLLIFGLDSDGPARLPAGVGCAAAGSRQDSSAGEGGSARSNPFHQVQQFFFYKQ
jgi:hypothetical protein